MRSTRKPSDTPSKRYYDRNRTSRIADSRARTKKWREDNPEEHKKRTRSYHLKAKYGITQDDYEAMLAAQDNCCAICRSPEPNHFRGWNIDHCHAGGQVRGVLCHHCNLMLGNARDNPALLLAAADYLKRNG